MNTTTPAVATETPPPTASQDAAWVTVPGKLPTETLMALCRDVEAILRVNPYYYFESWETAKDGRHNVSFRNHSNDQDVSLAFTVDQSATNEVVIHYETGLKKTTVFRVEPDESGSKLIIIDDYAHLDESERESRLQEVDKSLNAWGAGLQVYFARMRRWAWLPGWRSYIRRVWIPMKPSSRRIVWMLYLITAVEFAFFLFIMLIYVIEQAR